AGHRRPQPRHRQLPPTARGARAQGRGPGRARGPAGRGGEPAAQPGAGGRLAPRAPRPARAAARPARGGRALRPAGPLLRGRRRLPPGPAGDGEEPDQPRPDRAGAAPHVGPPAARRGDGTVSGMTCDRAAELFSDDLEGTLDPVLAAELAFHLSGCPQCRALRRALSEVVDLLRVPAREPAADLADRVARESWVRTRPRPARPSRTRVWAHAIATGAGWLSEVPFAVQAIAAAFAIALTAGLLLAASSAPGAAGRPRV